MFQGKLPNGLFPRDVVLWLDGLDGGYADRKTKTAYTATNMTKGVDINGGTELIFNGTSSVIGCGSIGNVNAISMWVKPTTTTGYLIDLDGTAQVSIVSNVVTTSGITSPTIYIDGIVTSIIQDGSWNHLCISWATAINASACNIGKIGSNFNSGSITNILFFNKQITQNQVGQLYNRKNTSTLASILNTGNVTFYKDFTKLNNIVADYSVGSNVGTFTVTRSAATPCTYVDVNGVVTVQTDTNPRFTYGLYDVNGFVSLPGVIIEGATTNLIPKSILFNDAIWDISNTTDLVISDGSFSSPDGGTNASTITSAATNSTLLLHTAVTAQTFSIWIKRKTGTGNIDITANGGTTWVTQPVTSNWCRFQVTATSASQTCGIRIATSGDAIYVWGSQFEAIPFASTYVPTSSGAVTRNADTLSYVCASNRTGATESIFIKFSPFIYLLLSGSALYVLTSSQTKERIVYYASAQDKMALNPNFTDSSACEALSGVLGFNSNKPKVIAAVCNNTSTPYAKLYDNGIAISGAIDSTDNFTTPSFGTSFFIGSRSAATSNLYGIFQSVLICSDAKNSSSVATISDSLLNYTPVLTIGDSITLGLHSTDLFGYRRKLQKSLSSTKKMVGDLASPSSSSYYQVEHSGISGQTTSQILSRLPALLSGYFPSYKAGIVLLFAGTNDMTQGISASTAVNNVQQILNTIIAYNPLAKIYVALITPRTDGFDSATTSYNTSLNSMLATYKLTNPNVYAVDMNTAFKNDASWATDYIYDVEHPNDAGYDLIADTWYASMLANGDS